jgi:hypothetical protein
MNSLPVRSITIVIADSFGTAPSIEDISAFDIPDEMKAYATCLLDKNSAGTLTPDEYDDMMDYIYADEFLIHVQATARLAARGAS